MFFCRQKPKRIEALGGFVLGQIVRHKIDHAKVVITRFYLDLDDDGPQALASFGAQPNDEGVFFLSELEPIPQ